MINKFLKILIFAILILNSVSVYGINYTWDGSSSTAWNIAANWTPSGVPDSTSNVTIVSVANNPILSQNTKVANFTISNGTLDLNTFQLTIAGLTCNFSGGVIQNGLVNISNRTTSFLGTTFNCRLNVFTGQFSLSGGIFELPVMIQDCLF